MFNLRELLPPEMKTPRDLCASAGLRVNIHATCGNQLLTFLGHKHIAFNLGMMVVETIEQGTQASQSSSKHLYDGTGIRRNTRPQICLRNNQTQEIDD